jgi:sensor c-di-GMP phosphodiesterase-like protein
MSNLFAQALTTIAALVLVATPVSLALIGASHQSEQFHTRRAQALADQVAARVDAAGAQTAALAARLRQAAQPTCSAEQIALMRRLQIGASYLALVGRLEGKRLACVSQGDAGGFELAAPGAAQLVGALPVAPGTPLIALPDGSFFGFVHPQLLLGQTADEDATINSDGDEVVLTVDGAGGVRQLAARGGVAPVDAIVASRRAQRYPVNTLVRVPQRAVQAMTRHLQAWLVPPALAIGLSLLWVFVFLRRRHVSIPALLRAALRRDEFFLVYQPVIRLDNRRCVGAEALLRWRRQDGTLVGPDLFIPIAEASGLIGSITARMLALVSADLPAMVALAPNFRMSVNMAPQDLGAPAIVEQLTATLARAGVDSRNLVVEATERGLIDVKLATAVIRNIQAAGIRVAIDDFGTGYSCLSYLDTLNVDFIKIDKSFIDSVGTAAPTHSVVGHIIEMAKSLDLLMVAEGVETEAQAEFLRRRGVQFAQGWLFARPMCAQEFLAYLTAQSIAPMSCAM